MGKGSASAGKLQLGSSGLREFGSGVAQGLGFRV